MSTIAGYLKAAMPSRKEGCDFCPVKLADLEAWQAEVERLREACEFAHGAIMDAIGLEDGLDGADGEAVLGMIENAVPSISRSRRAAETEGE